MPEYGRLATAFYDLDKPEPQPDALAFYVEYAREVGGTALEPMCGSGRYLLPMLAAGLEVHGADSSQSMLDACQARLAQRGQETTLLQQSIERLVPPRQYDLVFIPNGSFCLLTDPTLIARSLGILHAALAPGGTLLLELERLQAQAPEVSGTWGGRWLDCPDGSKLIFSWLGQYNGRADVTSSLHRYERVVNGRIVETEVEEFNVKSYAWQEALDLLGAAGFAAIQAYAPYARRAPDEQSEAWIFAARKA